MLKDITNVELTANLLVSQHILVSTPTQKHKFVVYHGKEWVAKIIDAKKNMNGDYLLSDEPSSLMEITVKCQGCGGINTIRKGTVAECDFCGSVIKGE